MKQILGLDLGSTSIGWAVVSEDDQALRLERLGCRIIPLSTDDATEFLSGNAISKNEKRTQRRTQRKGYNRYQQRRALLQQFLQQHAMLPDESLKGLDKLSLWGLRARAVSEQLSLPELGRVLYHLNQKRGYKATKADYDADGDKKQGEYVKAVMGRHRMIAERGITIGQLFFEKLSEDPSYRTKEQVFPRRAYEEEFDRIVACQRQFYPTLFTEENIDTLRNRIIYYQRGLKSCKHLVSLCDFEKRAYLNAAGKTVFNGPKVAPKSSPLAQVCKIWESVNNLTLKNRRGETLEIAPEERRALFEHLNTHDKLTLTDLYRILGIRKTDGWWAGKAIGKGLQGNTTRNALRKALAGQYDELLRFNLTTVETNQVDAETGEIIQMVSESYLDEPLYRLWHAVYSIPDKEDLSKTLQKQFGITDLEVVENLFAIDFVKAGYANKSAKAMRRILPYLELGLKYAEACEAAGFRHSESLTVQERETKTLLPKLRQIEKNELRQPVVEKILNQMVNVVNALMDRYGHFDEIRVELARELKQSRDERNETTKRITKNERENRAVAEQIATDYQLTPTRNRIRKYKLWEESGHVCIYCNSVINASEFLQGVDSEKEHIIPRSLFFDDSFSNLACSCRKCNAAKGNRTAYDFMQQKSEAEFADYLDRVEKLYKEKKISKTKYERLLTPESKIPTDFIDRQLRESQYIARKAREILSGVCRQVTVTSGSVTDFLRRTWGWDHVLHDLNFDRYRAAGLTEIKDREQNGRHWQEEGIRNWNKRLDHRHHAIDALVIACTKQGYIQRLNTLSQWKDVSFAPTEAQGEVYRTKRSKLERYIVAQPHFSVREVQQAARSVLISFKAGKKVASTGKRYSYRQGKRVLMQQHILIPRGALHEESVYGVVNRYAKNRRGETVIEQKSVLRYPLATIDRKQIDSIVDSGMRKLVQQRFDSHSGSDKEVWKDLQNDPLLFNGVPVKSVRRMARPDVSSLIHLHRGGYVLPGSNHHIAIYRDRAGKLYEHCVTFWQAIERKRYGLPVVITHPEEVWNRLPEGVPDTLMEQLPLPEYSFVVSLQQNEMFVIGMAPELFEEAMRNQDYALLGQHLYRVQKLSSGIYYFRLHVETGTEEQKQDILAKKVCRFASLKAFFAANPTKVRISLLGEISKV